MTPAQCNELVKRLLGAFPTQWMKMSDDQQLAMTMSYTAALLDLEFDLALRAVDRMNKTAEWIPKISEIRAEAAELAVGRQRSGSEAWGDVMAAVRKLGARGEPVFADPLVAQAVAAIGWRAICMADETDASPRARFAEVYGSLATSARKEVRLSLGGGGVPSLPGGITLPLLPSGPPVRPERAASRARIAREGQPRSIGQLALAAASAAGRGGPQENDPEGDDER